LVDVGAGTSDICITKEGSIVAYGMIPFAGDELTEVIARECLLDFKSADKLKVDASSKKKNISYK
jgi:cell division ATPase FtsA